MSCLPAGSCTAVGYHFSGSGAAIQALVESWDGASWSIVASPNGVGPASYLTGVSCVSAQSCTASGADLNSSDTYQTLVESWNGTDWSVVPTPDVGSNATNVLDDVACVTATSCTAVGYFFDSSNGERSLIETLSGSEWTIVAVPNGPGTAFLQSVSCISATSCTAVGYHSSDTLVESWNGVGWSVVPSANTGSVASQLGGVSCISASSCIAVGWHAANSNRLDHTLAESWNGSNWSILASRDREAINDVLAGVSCSSTTSCTAVGSYVNNDRINQTLVESWDGASWSLVASPDTANGDDHLLGVACVTASLCVAVGYQTTTAGTDQILIESWDGASWSMMPAPNGGQIGRLQAISCLSPTSCTAVGSASFRTIVETWDGTSWTIVPTPDAGTVSAFDAISCLSGTSCTAVGSHARNFSEVTLTEMWDGNTWSIQESPNNTAVHNILQSVSCVSANSCVAVGQSWDIQQSPRTLTETWDGSNWSIQASPNSGTGTALQGVSCLAASCMAVGQSYDSSSVPQAVTESWDGATWSIVANGPADTTGSYLNAVSCGGPVASGASCMAAGARTTTDANVTLIEQYSSEHPLPPPLTSPSIASEASGPVAAGGTIFDTATLTGGDNPTGSITFNVYGPDDATCTRAPASTSTRTVTGNGDYTSDPFTATAPGTYRYVAGYRGDANNTPAATGCNGANSDVVVTPLKGYTPLTPVRICDTRAAGNGVAANRCQRSGGAAATLGRGFITVRVAGLNAVPVTARAVVLNVTATNTTTASYLTVWPSGVTQPTASNLNWMAGQTVPNLVEVPIGAGGTINVYNNAGTTDVVIDLEGYVDVAAPGLYHPQTPARLCDSRALGVAVAANECQRPGGAAAPLGVGHIVVAVAGKAGVPLAATAVEMNVTVTDTTTAGFLIVWPDGAAQPVASNLNWAAHQTVANRVIVPLGADGKIDVFNATGTTNVVIDIGGYYTDQPGGSGYLPISPRRLCDTRAAQPPAITDNSCNHTGPNPIAAHGVLAMKVTPPAGIALKAVVLNVTVTGPTADSYLTVYPGNVAQPFASDLNWAPGQTVANLVVVQVGPDNGIRFYNNTGRSDLVVDVEGYYTTTPTV